MAFSGFSFRKNTISAIALTAAMLTPMGAFAADVTLKSEDGTVNLVGEFVDFVDNTYIIRTGLGDLRISASRVRCEGDACPTLEVTEADVKIAGSETVGVGVMPLLLSGYAAYIGAESTATTGADGQIVAEMVADEGFGDPLGSYLVTSTGSSDAFATLLEGTSDIGMSSRRITPTEARALRDKGAGHMVAPEQERILAVDTLVVITHPNNPVDELTMEQLRGIYSGTITNWSEVGGDDAPIKLISRQADSGTRAVFDSRVFDGAAPEAPASMVIAEDSSEMASLVNQDENALGFVGYAFQRGAHALTLVNECGLHLKPSAFAARSEEYPLQRFIYLYNREDIANDAALDFLNYAISPAADEVIAKAGFIDLGIGQIEQTLDSERARQLTDPSVDPFEAEFMRDMLTSMVGYDRLSTTFRFRTGSQKLSPRGMLNMERLASHLEAQPEGTKIMFVGFTDDVGAFESNRDLSQSRAEIVRDTLQEFAGDRLANIEMDVAGYGEIAPVACNSNENDRAINRRVEVWIETPATR